MSWLIDTNVLLRLADTGSTEHALAKSAIENLIGREESLFLCPQILVEFWAVATRPTMANGLAWSTAFTAEMIGTLRIQFPMLDDVVQLG